MNRTRRQARGRAAAVEVIAMAIELPADLAVIDERLRSLEDRILAERLFIENPELFSQGPPQTEREVLAWATRRFGTVVIAVTAAVSIAAGYLLGPLVLKHDRPSTAAAVPAQHRAKAVPARAPSAHVARAVPVHVAHAAPVHVAPAAPVVLRHAPVVTHHAAVVYPPVHHRTVVAAPIPNQASYAENERAMNAEYARRQRAAAAHDAALRQARATATAQQHAARTEPAPRTQPRTETATGVATGSATTTASGPIEAQGPAPQQPVDVPAPSGNPRSPVTNPSTVWNERPPLPVGPLGNPAGPVMADPCTPRRGRLGAVLDTLQRVNASSGGHIRF
jgi:hypothetical protein